MALVVPFRGISYNPNKIENFQEVVAPPYDVISPSLQDLLYQRNPYNVIRLILNKENPDDTPANNRYTRSAELYRAWLRDEILLRARRPHFYFLQEEFNAARPVNPENPSPPGKRVRRGFIGLIGLENLEAGLVFAHEKTQAQPKADRLALMEACRANMSQIFSLYPDEEGSLSSVYEKVFSAAPPTLDILDDEGIHRKLWPVDDPAILHRVTDAMGGKKIFIADGHHRYETALAYRDRERQRFPGASARATYHFTMMYFAAMEDEGVCILPTHRVVSHLEKFQPERFLRELETDFSVEAFPFRAGSEESVRNQVLQELARRSRQSRSLGMKMQGDSRYFLLTLKNEKSMVAAARDMSPALRSLDVNLLHVLVFQERLHIEVGDLTAGQYVSYFKEPEEAARTLASGKGLIAFFLNPTQVHQVRDVGLAGETMPSKSTFFYPKLLSGLVINPLERDEEIVDF
jgi:uncharacterized protein (DUF1015 family)